MNSLSNQKGNQKQ